MGILTNKIIILTTMLLISIIGIISAADINTYYALNLNYDKSNFTLLSTDIEQSRELITNPSGMYTATLFDYENNVLDIYFFDVPNKILYDEVDEKGRIVGGGEGILEEVNFSLFLPYYKNSTKIIIYDENITRKIEIDVSSYSREYKAYEEYKESVAENQSISGENELTNQEKNVTNEEMSTKEETFLEKASQYWWVLLIILIILLAILINYIGKNKKV